MHKRCKRHILLVVEEEKTEKKLKLKVWFQIQNLSTFKDGCLTSNLYQKKLPILNINLKNVVKQKDAQDP